MKEKCRIFEKGLIPKYHDLVSVQMRHTFKEVIDVTMIVEKNFIAF